MKNSIKLNKKKLAVATTSALLAMLYANIAKAASTPYPEVPLIWQSGTTVIKPNILLFLDTSGSMSLGVNGQGVGGADKPNSRLSIAKNAITNVIGSTREEYRWGLATFVSRNYGLRMKDVTDGADLWSTADQWYSIGGQIQSNINDVDSKTPASRGNYNQLVNRIAGLPANTNTPITGSYYELIRYYRGMSPGLLNLPTPTGTANYISPIQYRCQKNYIIYISDGEPTGYAERNQLGVLYHNDALMSGLKTQIWSQRNQVGAMAGSVAGFAFNNDLMVGGVDAEGRSFDDPTGSPADGSMDFSKQTITTHTVAFAANVNLLNQMATQGGGQYLLASDGPGLERALEASMTAIGRDAGYTPASPAVAQAVNGTVTAAVSTTVNPKSWTSELRFYTYNAANKTFNLSNYQTPKYKNGNTLTSRALFSTHNGVVAVAPGTYPPAFNNNLFGISPGRTDVPHNNSLIIPITKSNNPNEYRALMAWLLRWNSTDEASGVDYRDRNDNKADSLARFMGDVGGNISMFGDIKRAAANSNDYDRREFIAVPSNDGMLHILQANGGSDDAAYPYIETLQYIPGTAQRNQASDTIARNLVFTAEKKYGDLRNPKQNFINGELLNIKATDGERSIVGGLGSGARGFYSLMMGGRDHNNNPVGMHQPVSSWATSVPWWDTSTHHFGAANSFYNQIGYNFGLPKVGYVSVAGNDWNNDVRAAALITSGMDDPNAQTPGLFVLDHMGKNYAIGKNRASTATPGQLIRKIPITRNYSATANAEASVAQIVQAHDGLTSAQAVDIDRDGLSDLVYAGDYKGNVWRFDLRSANPSGWGARMVYQGTGTQPLIAEPNLMNWGNGVVGVYFGTGSNQYQSDLKTHAQQSIYGIFDHVDACPVSAANSGICAPATRADLIQQQLTGEDGNGVYGYYISTSNNYPDATTRRGFYLDAPDTEYRITTTPEIVTVRGRSSAGVIWNIEKIVAADDAAGAVLTCTPDATSTSGYRLITDAYNGAINPYIKWSNAPISINGRTYNTIPYSGSSSRSLFLTNSDSSYRQSGTLGSGSMPPPGKPPVELAQSPCTGVGSIGSSTSTGGVQLDEITCDSAQGVRRLSWREIF